MALWNSPSEGYTEENIRMFISAYNKRVVEADLEIGADRSVLSESEITGRCSRDLKQKINCSIEGGTSGGVVSVF